MAKRGDVADWDGSDYIVPAFPQQLNVQPKAGIFVAAVYTNTPLALAGIHEGDLILRVDHKPAGKLKLIRSYFAMGLAVSTKLELDLFPDPDFSLIALGYSRNERRIELNSPHFEFVRQLQAQDQKEPSAEHGIASYEGWRAWLAIFSLGSRMAILSQQAVKSAEMSAVKP